jgi:TfoX/Sxy family transcriptional regulator of competence genes
MAWVKVPSEHHPIFRAALPRDPRVETQPMFGGLAAKVHGHIFAGLFGRSVMLALDEPQRAEALALEGAGPFDPMGDGRARSQKVMLPEAMMEDPPELRTWIRRAFDTASKLPPKATKPAKAKATKPAKAKATPKAKASPKAKATSKSKPRSKSKSKK